MYLDKLISLLYIDLLAVFGAALRQSPPLIYLKTSSTTTKNMQSATLCRQGKNDYVIIERSVKLPLQLIIFLLL